MERTRGGLQFQPQVRRSNPVSVDAPPSKAAAPAPPQQYITVSTRDFLTIMEAVCTFSTTVASFAAAHAILADRMTRTEAAMAQTSDILAQNQAILIQLQSDMGLLAVSPYVPTQASATPLPVGSAPPPTAPADPLDVLAAAAKSATPPAAP